MIKYKSRLIILLILYWGLIAPIISFSKFNINSIDSSSKLALKNKISLSAEPTITQMQTPISTLQPVEITIEVTPEPTIKPVESVKQTVKSTLKVTMQPKSTILSRSTENSESNSNISNSGINFKSEKMMFKVSAYDLSVASCGKSRSDPNFGLTNSDFNLSGHTRKSALTIAADTRILPMGTKVFIEFCNGLEKYNDFYVVRDTGSAIKGYVLDLFMGDGSYDECIDFGVQKAYVRVVE